MSGSEAQSLQGCDTRRPQDTDLIECNRRMAKRIQELEAAANQAKAAAISDVVATIVLNQAARAILDRDTAQKRWCKVNLLDDKRLSHMVNDLDHYISSAGHFAAVVALRSCFVLKTDMTTQQFNDLAALMAKVFTKKRHCLPNTKAGELEKPRTQWLGFLELVTRGLFNTLDPRETGASKGDYFVRIAAIAEKVREVVFGPVTQRAFRFKENATTERVIYLPDKEVICEEIRNKLDARGFNDRRFIKRSIEEYNDFMADQMNPKYTPGEREAHLRSGSIIEAYNSTCKALGASYKKGRKRVFSECYTVDLSTYKSIAAPSSSRHSGSPSSGGSSSSSNSSSAASSPEAPAFDPFAQPASAKECPVYGDGDEQETQKDEIMFEEK